MTAVTLHAIGCRSITQCQHYPVEDKIMWNMLSLWNMLL